MNFKKQYFLDKKDAELAYNFRRLFIRAIVLIIVFLLVVFIINYNQKRAFATAQLLVHTKDVIFQSEKTISLVKDYETSARGFAISGKEEFLEPVRNTKDSIKNAVLQLRRLTSDNPSQQTTVDSLSDYIQKRIIISDSSIYLRKHIGLNSALEFISNGFGKKCMDTIRILEKKIQQRENELLAQSKSANIKATIINQVTLLISLFTFFIVLIILFWQAWFNLKKYNNRQTEVNSILRQLAQSLMNAQKIAHIGSWQWNVITNEEKWSDEQYRIFGYEPGAIPVTHEFFLNAIHPCDRAMVETTIADAVGEKKPYNIRFRIIQPGGALRHINALGEVYLNQQQPEIMAGTMQDITEQIIKEKEKEQLAGMLEKINEVARIGWWEADLITGKRKWSNVTKEILEVMPDFEPGADSDVFFIKEKQSREMMENVFSEAVINGTPYDITLPFVTAKGNSMLARAIGQAEFEDGQCIRVYGVLQHIILQNEFQPV